MKKKIIIRPQELADLYALKTLYDYAKDKVPNAHFEFNAFDKIPRVAEMLEGIDTKLCELEHMPKTYNNLIQAYSDVGGRIKGKHNLIIDVSLLKNAVTPLTQDEKAALRTKYNIPSNKPLCVVGFAFGSHYEMDLFHKLKEVSNVAFVGDLDIHKFQQRYDAYLRHQLNVNYGLHHPRIVTERGLLRDYFAMADIAVNSRLLTYDSQRLHNFVEATEGGPLFMRKPSIAEQFGYNELVNAGAIKQFELPEEAVDAAVHYARNFTGAHAHLAPRASHLEQSRDKYLPLLVGFINHVFNRAEAPKSYLNTVSKKGETTLKVCVTHPDTDWDRGFNLDTW